MRGWLEVFQNSCGGTDGFGSGLSAVSTRSSDLHRVRRGAMSSYFSMSNVRKYEPVVAGNVSELLHRLKKSQENNQVVNLADAYRCLAMDVVNSFAVPEPRKMLEVPDFGKGFNGLMRDFSRLIALQRHLLIVFPVVKAIPDWLTVRMDPTGASKMLVDYMRSFETQTRKVVERHGKPPPGQAMSVLDAIYTSAELDRRDKVVGRIVEEAQNVVGAGTETTGATLTNLTYHLLINPPMLTKLRDELSTAANNSTSLLDYRTLEKLPYLQACINEALRLCCPVTGRLPRVNPRAPTTYTDPNGTTYTFPAGTVMSMSMPDLHFNASIFPDPHLFRPERWLESSSEQQAAMQRFFVPFGKGSRNCLGMEVAKMELALTAGNVFRELGGKMALWETSARDVGWAYDFFAPYVPADSPGLRVKVV